MTEVNIFEFPDRLNQKVLIWLIAISCDAVVVIKRFRG